MRGHLIVW